MIGDQILASSGGGKKGVVDVWELPHLQEMEKEISVGELKDLDEDSDMEEDGMERSSNGELVVDWREDTWMDEEGIEDAECTYGQECHSQFKLRGLSGQIYCLQPLNADNESPSLVASISYASDSAIWVHDWETKSVSSILLGHEADVTGLSTADGLPNWILSSSEDGELVE